MLSPNALTLDYKKAKIWENYRDQRVSELKSQYVSTSDDILTNIAWKEFLTLKWGLETDENETKMNGIEYALHSYQFGPDTRGIPSFIRSFK